MKSLFDIVASMGLLLAAHSTGTAKLGNDTTIITTTEAPSATSTSTTADTATTTTTTTSSAPLFSPTALASYQHPVVLPNGVECIGPYLVMATSESKPDQVYPQTAQIGPNAFVALRFNQTHKGKTCRFHFAFSNIADGGNGIGTEDIFALNKGGVTEKLTFRTQPAIDPVPVAQFKVSGNIVIDDSPGPHELYPFVKRSDFPCPTVSTGWLIRGSKGSLSNWSWNHGLVVEVLGDNPWVGGDVY